MSPQPSQKLQLRQRRASIIWTALIWISLSVAVGLGYTIGRIVGTYLCE